MSEYHSFSSKSVVLITLKKLLDYVQNIVLCWRTSFKIPFKMRPYQLIYDLKSYKRKKAPFGLKVQSSP